MKSFLSILTFSMSLLLVHSQAQAVCPICTVAVGAGLGVSRLIGIDDTITGLWIGGLILSSGLWMADFIRKRSWNVPYPEIFSTLLMLVFVIPPLYWGKMIGISGNTLMGVDKILLGTIFGFMLFLLSVELDNWLRTKNNGKVFIYYQKVIIPVLSLSLASLILYLVN